MLTLLEVLRKRWPIKSYNTLRKNCCHFSDEFCQRPLLAIWRRSYVVLLCGSNPSTTLVSLRPTLVLLE